MEDNALLKIVVFIEGTDASNTPHLKRANGRPLSKVLVRAIPLPRGVCLDMHVSLEDGVYKISHVEWRITGKQGILILHTTWGIWYHNQGPDELQGTEKVERFFDDYIRGMMSQGWEAEF